METTKYKIEQLEDELEFLHILDIGIQDRICVQEKKMTRLKYPDV